MIEAARFLSPEERVEHNAELIEDLLRQSRGEAFMNYVLYSSDLNNHMSPKQIKKAFSWGLRNERFDFDQRGTDEPVVFIITE